MTHGLQTRHHCRSSILKRRSSKPFSQVCLHVCVPITPISKQFHVCKDSQPSRLERLPGSTLRQRLSTESGRGREYAWRQP
jgi:hypothetical protein